MSNTFERGETVVVVTANNEAVLGRVISDHGVLEEDVDRVTVEYENVYGGRSRMHPTRDRVGHVNRSELLRRLS